MKRLLALFLFASWFGALAACSTVEGLGEDIQKVGGKISGSAREKQQQQQQQP